MNTSTNVHNADTVWVEEDSHGKTQWLNVQFKGDMGTHSVTIFNLHVSDLAHACEKAMFADKKDWSKEDVIAESDVGYVI